MIEATQSRIGIKDDALGRDEIKPSIEVAIHKKRLHDSLSRALEDG